MTPFEWHLRRGKHEKLIPHLSSFPPDSWSDTTLLFYFSSPALFLHKEMRDQLSVEILSQFLFRVSSWMWWDVCGHSLCLLSKIIRTLIFSVSRCLYLSFWAWNEMRRLNDLPSLSPCLVVPKSVAPKTRVTNEEEARSDKHHIKEARRGRATASFCSGSFIFLLRERKRC